MAEYQRFTRADVYKNGQLAATLRRTSQGVSLTYRSDWTGAALAHSLPVTDEPQNFPALPAYFANLLPKGAYKRTLCKAVNTAKDDELSLLVALGADLVGDIQVVPVGEPPEAPDPLVMVEDGVAEVDFADLLAEDGLVDLVGFPGNAVKVTAGVAGEIIDDGSRYILKIGSAQEILAEAWSLRMAKKLPIPVVDFEVVYDISDVPGLLVRRFDRLLDREQILRLAVADGCQLTDRSPADKFEPSFADLAEACASVCPAALVARRAVLAAEWFCYLIGDDLHHAKKTSVVEVAPGDWRVAPLYGVRSRLRDQNRTLSKAEALATAHQLGLPEAAAARLLQNVLVATEPAAAQVDSILGSKIEGILKKRRQALAS